MTDGKKVVEGDDYQRLADMDLQEVAEMVPASVLLYFKQLQRTAVNLRSIQQATNDQFAVVLGSLGGNAAACIDTNTKKKYIGQDTLMDWDFSLHAALHEMEHQKSGIFKLKLDILSPADQQLLQKELGLTEPLDQNTLIEGFNELSTFEKHKRNEHSGYAGKEVPVAEKLELLAKKHLNKSLLDIYRRGDAEEFVVILQTLAVRLQLKEFNVDGYMAVPWFGGSKLSGGKIVRN